MVVLTNAGDGIVGKKIIYIAGKVTEPRLVARSRRHGGLQGTLYDAEAYTDIVVEV
jgi:hypothetical protein